MHWYKWSAGEGHKPVNFGDQEVKGQGHTRPEIDFDWRPGRGVISYTPWVE